jgi:hypothetical protein
VPLSPYTSTVERVEHLAHPAAATDDVGELAAVRLQVLLEDAVLARQPRALDGVAQHAGHFVVLERLGDVVEGAALHRRQRRLDRREGGHHHDGQVLVHRPELAEHGQAVDARHHDVDDDGVERVGAGQLEPLHAVDGQADVVAFTLEQCLEHLAHHLLVVDDEDRSPGSTHGSVSWERPQPALVPADSAREGRRSGKDSVNRVP